MTGYEVFRLERRGAVAIVWLNRPEKLNAMAPVFFRELPHVLEAAAAGGAGAIVLTGAGRAFSAGGDIATFVGARRPRRVPPPPAAPCSTPSGRSSAPSCR